MDFVSTDEFQTSISQQKEADKVFHWKELPQGKIFKVLKLETFHSSKYNKNCYVLTLCDIKQDSTKVWATEFLVEKLTQKSPKQIPYLTSLGQEPIKGGKKINAFDLYMKEGSENYEI